jgi:putative protease
VKHELELGDSTGRRHPVVAEAGCRNTVFGAEAQEASQHLSAWLEAGIRHYRLEFAHESAGQVASVAEAFRAALTGDLPLRRLGDARRRAAPPRTTQGILFVPSTYPELPVLG